MRTDFAPDRDAFAFANSWSLSPDDRESIRSTFAEAIDRAIASVTPRAAWVARALGVDRALADRVATGMPATYGLCGGMAFAALDYFRSGVPLPQAATAITPPPPGHPLRVYLQRRLIDSLELNGASFLAWIAALNYLPRIWPIDGGPRWLAKRSRTEWASLKGHLDAGEPWPVGLIGATSDPFSDHQVLAIGYEDAAAGAVRLFVYDMNCPGATQQITVAFEADALASDETCAGARGPLRGLLCERYAAAEPPQ